MIEWSMGMNAAVFAAAAVVIAVVGSRLSAVADRLADRTGMGEALTGAILLGAATSLPGITASVSAAWAGLPRLALSNAVGGIAAQTAFLAVADFTYRKANLEHAAASLGNLLNGTLMIVLLGAVLIAATGPNVTVLGVHPVTPLMALGYVFGLRLVRRAKSDPLWTPTKTRATVPDVPEEVDPSRESLAGLWGRFGVYGGLLAACGWAVAKTGGALASQTGLGESVVGAVFTAVATSTPELVTTVAAVRRGALTLAVGGVLGGNAFDVMFAAAADVAYRAGSVYHAASPAELMMTAVALVMAGVLVMGMLVRERRGPVNVGFESVAIVLIYTAGVGMLVFG